MTTDKLPDVVWYRCIQHESVTYIDKSALDAMTAERDSAREALAKLRKKSARVEEMLKHAGECRWLENCPGCQQRVRAFLAAQPEPTK